MTRYSKNLGARYPGLLLAGVGDLTSQLPTLCISADPYQSFSPRHRI